MCGISGFYQYNADFTNDAPYYNDILKKMTQVLVHRGPDDHGTILSKHCGLAHTRLSIIDLVSGAQPMTKTLSSYGYHIVYNGEIYNTAELKRKLNNCGIKQSTTSDTEILLQSFLEFGASFVHDVNGIFAFAIYDERHETLTLFRDSFGVKPLFYTWQNNTLIFSSEPKGILQYPGMKACLDEEGLCELIGLGPARNPGSGIYRGFHELLPGHYMTCCGNHIHTVCYYRLQSHPHEDSYEQTIARTKELVTSAIKNQMVSDVPICTFLSGGVDSSLVSSVCADQLKKRNQQLDTYSFDFIHNDRFFQSNDFQPAQDEPYVQQMVAYLQSNHVRLMCDTKTQADALYESVDAHDMPCMADIDSSLLHFCRQVSQHHKVVLTGECADEVFGGYPWFHKPEFLESATFPWTPSLAPRQEIFLPALLNRIHLTDYVADSYNTAISEIDVLPKEDSTETSRRRISYLNIRYFMQTLLNRMDRTSMHSGLEARVPFADRDLVDYIFNVPWSMKAKDGIVKNILRQSARGLLPDEILFRRKSPYPKTYDPAYEHLLSSRLKEVLQNPSAPILPLLDLDSVNQFLMNPKDYGKPWYGQLMAGPQMIAYLLQFNYFLEKYQVEIKI